MKKNKIKIKGNNNQTINDINNSTIKSGNGLNESDSKQTGISWTVIGIIISLLALIVAVIAEWKNIVAFF